MARVPRAISRKFPGTFVSRSQRKQVYLPEFTIALIRTPFLAPRFAAFYVPLNFNKLDLRDYLDRLYGVKALKIRSVVEQQKPTRERPLGKNGYGRWRRPQSQKRMTVELAEPFVWPEEPKDLNAWEHDQFWKAARYQQDAQDKQKPDAAEKPDTNDREAYEKQAKELLEGKRVWRPTWQALGLSYDRSPSSLGKSVTSSSMPSTPETTTATTNTNVTGS